MAATLATAKKKCRSEDLDKPIADSVERLFEVHRHVKSILNACDPVLVAEDSLNNLNTQLSNINQQVQSFLQNSNPGYLMGGGQTANKWADSALVTVAQLFVPRTPEAIEGIKDRITRFRQSAGIHATNLKKEVATARREAKSAADLATKKAQEIDQRLDKKIQEIDQKVEQTLNSASEQSTTTVKKAEAGAAQVLERLEKRIESYEQDLDAQKKRIDDSITEFQSQFSTAQETRREDFSKEQKTRRDDFQEILDEAVTALDENSQEFKKSAEAILNRMEESEEKVVRVMEVVGTTGLTGGFKKAANEEKRAADLWRWIAVASIAAVIGVAAWTVFWSDAQPGDWYELAKKIFLTAAIGWLAGYAIKESGAHRDREKRNRRLELQLASLNPYLANLKLETQEKIKDELIKTLFHQQEEIPQSTPEGGGWISVDKLMDLIQRVLNRPGT